MGVNRLEIVQVDPVYGRDYESHGRDAPAREAAGERKHLTLPTQALLDSVG